MSCTELRPLPRFTLGLLSLCSLFIGASVVQSVPLTSSGCKSIPGDKGWPNSQQWSQLNASVDGRLIKTIPPGAPCYRKTYNVADFKYDIDVYANDTCSAVQAGWHMPTFHDESSSSVMQTYFANDSCNPLDVAGNCGIGSYVQYAINVTSDADARAGLAFAQAHNIRLLVRNTGHDYLGKSTGFGALALWTHHLKNISLIDQWKSKDYDGPALKIGAGVQVGDMYDFLESRGYMALGGECPTVGVAGGYIFAGGHAPTSSKLGLAADKILSISAILANGTAITATPYENQDIYWFLSGSGAGGTIAYISSVTFKIFKDFSVSGAILTFPYATYGISEDEFWPLIDTWHSITPGIADAGAYAYALYSQGSFQIWPLFAPDLTQNQTVDLIKPFVNALDNLKTSHANLTYNLTSYTYPTFNQAYKSLFPYLGSGTLQWTSRLIPRNIIENQPKNVSTVFKTLFDDGATMVEAIMNPSLNASKPLNNSVLPAWRNTVIDLVAGKPYNDTAPFQQMANDRTYITQHWTSALEQLAPVCDGGGTYMNEADADDPNFQESFYGYYEQQLRLKKKYDPDGVWYAKTAVGSEYWAEDAQQRLCPVTPKVSY